MNHCAPNLTRVVKNNFIIVAATILFTCMVSDFKRCILAIDAKGNKFFLDGILSALNSALKFVMFAIGILTESRSSSSVKWDL